jgi:hypothetical protein
VFVSHDGFATVSSANAEALNEVRQSCANGRLRVATLTGCGLTSVAPDGRRCQVERPLVNDGRQAAAFGELMCVAFSRRCWSWAPGY